MKISSSWDCLPSLGAELGSAELDVGVNVTDIARQYIEWGATEEATADCHTWAALFAWNGNHNAPGVPGVTGLANLAADCEARRAAFGAYATDVTRVLSAQSWNTEKRVAVWYNVTGQDASTGDGEDGWVDGWMDGWMDGCLCVSLN